MQRFVHEMQNLLPTIPENSYVNVTIPPEGRAFTQAALRVFYNNPKIFWKDNLQELQQLPNGASGILIDFNWEENWYYGKQPRAFFIEPN
ncbi:hypothetical protein [Geotalea sp. SG265]|uniref:hypothetical protein n=1 Tax=Geotalea sp. SG265 TaxID=2922867 RepID=UPI001FAF46AF|nr:hypothetical protein [Geotalea sp. SG265]